MTETFGRLILLPPRSTKDGLSSEGRRGPGGKAVHSKAKAHIPADLFPAPPLTGLVGEHSIPQVDVGGRARFRLGVRSQVGR